MTLALVVLRRDDAIVGTDTATLHPDGAFRYRADGTLHEHSKIYPLAHCSAVLLVRGPNCVADLLLRCAIEWHDVDGALERIPELLRFAGQGLGLEPATSTRHRAFRRGEVYLVGPSRHRACMVCGLFETDSSWVRFATSTTTANQAGQSQAWLAPHLPFAEWPKREITTPQEALEHARAQIAHVVTDESGEAFTGPNTPFGGQLLVAEITQEGIRMSTPGDLGWPTRRAAIVAAAGSLVACGGGDPMPALNIANESATAVALATAVSKETDHSASANSTVTACTASYLNITGGTIWVQCDVGFSGGYYYGTGGLLDQQKVWIDQTGAVSGSSQPVVTEFVEVWDLTDTFDPRNATFQWQVASGQTLSAALKLTTHTNDGIPSVTMLHLDNLFVRLTAIKR